MEPRGAGGGRCFSEAQAPLGPSWPCGCSWSRLCRERRWPPLFLKLWVTQGCNPFAPTALLQERAEHQGRPGSQETAQKPKTLAEIKKHYLKVNK